LINNRFHISAYFSIRFWHAGNSIENI
jgi:hypothetical protein